MTSKAHLVDEELLGPMTRPQEEHLRGCASCAHRRDVQLRVRTAVRGLERTAAPSPKVLTALDEAADERPRSRRWISRTIAGAAVAVVLVTGVLLVAAPRGETNRLSAPLRDELVLDHLHYAPLAEPAQVASADPLVVAAGLQQRLGRPVIVPSWEATTLIGGRSCRIQSEWVPLVLYERAGRRISLFEIPSAHVTAEACEQADGNISICSAPSGRGGAYVAVAALPPHEVSRLLSLVHGS